MALTARDWSVVVVGKWNRAILTPAGIGKHLFRVSPDTPLDVLLPVDVIAPPLVKFDGITVVAGDDRLVVQPDAPSYSRLDRARQIACNALDFLPKTPVTAVGLNVRFTTDTPSNQLLEICTNSLDSALSDASYNIDKRSYMWSLPWDDVTINLTILLDSNGACAIQLNFHLQSDDPNRQTTWLREPIDHFQQEVRRLIVDCMHLDSQEIPNAQ